jgi:pimeloyl-ACP methyl ester carboxylesterase
MNRLQPWRPSGGERTSAGLSMLVAPGHGPALVLLHGAAGNAAWWEPAARAWTDRHVVAVDLPGHGAAPGAGTWDVAATAHAVRRSLRDVLGERPAIWGGHSWGGKVAAVAASLFQEEVAGLLLVDPSPIPGIDIEIEAFVDMAFTDDLGPWPSRERALAELLEREHFAGLDAAMRAMAEQALAAGLVADRSGEGAVRARVDRDRMLRLCEAVLLSDLRDVVGHPSCPTLLVTADSSGFWQEPTKVAALPGAEHTVLPGNHWIHWHAAAAFHQCVADWLGRHWTARE